MRSLEDGGMGTKHSGESREHRMLKRLSKLWMKGEGYRISGTEVRIPLSNFRADVAGYRPHATYSVNHGDTMVVECKASRADFLRDAGIEEDLLEERANVRKRLEGLSEMLRMHLPDCRQGLSLFAEYDSYDFSTVRHGGWRPLTSQLELLGRKVTEGLKLSKVARYSSASFCYLAVEEGVLNSLEEVPPYWGVLVRHNEELVPKRSALRLAAREEVKLKLLERIAARNTR